MDNVKLSKDTISLNDRKRIVVLIGKSASGKDSVKEELCKNYEFKYVVPYTTRPKRENEVDGKDYHFIGKEDEDFRDRIVRGDFMEYRFYDFIKDGKDCWIGYATPVINEREGNFVIVNSLKGAESIVNRYGLSKCLIVYLKADDDIRKERATQRDNNFEIAEWERRLKSDEEDYSEEKLNKIAIFCIDTTNKSAAEVAEEVNAMSMLHFYLKTQKRRKMIKKCAEKRKLKQMIENKKDNA